MHYYDPLHDDLERALIPAVASTLPNRRVTFGKGSKLAVDGGLSVFRADAWENEKHVREAAVTMVQEGQSDTYIVFVLAEAGAVAHERLEYRDGKRVSSDAAFRTVVAAVIATLA